MTQGFTKGSQFTGIISPTVQRLTAASGTYTTPANVKFIRVTMNGGGGGGGGSCTSAGNDGGAAGVGGTSTFGTSLLTCVGGSGGLGTSQAAGGAGGTETVAGAGVDIASHQGTYGEGSQETAVTSVNLGGKSGGQNAFGGRGSGGVSAGAGQAAIVNSGAGGGGGGAPGTGITGSGGGAGGYVDAYIDSPAATYAYVNGAAGAAGAAGTGGQVGGAGGTGIIVVEEFYQAQSYATALTLPLTIANGGTGNAGASSAPDIIGVTDASNAQTGSVGEYISSSVLSGSAVSLTTATGANVTSISLTAGDWDVASTIATIPGGTTVIQQLQGGISQTSATLPTIGAENNTSFVQPISTASTTVIVSTSQMRINVSSTTTIYLVVNASFTVSTLVAYGFIGARRVR